MFLLSEHTFCIRRSVSFFSFLHTNILQVHLSGTALYFPEQFSAESSQIWQETDAEQIFKANIFREKQLQHLTRIRLCLSEDRVFIGPSVMQPRLTGEKVQLIASSLEVCELTAWEENVTWRKSN